MLTGQTVQLVEVFDRKSLSKTSSSKGNTTDSKDFETLLEKLKLSGSKLNTKKKLKEDMPQDLTYILTQFINLKLPEEKLTTFISEELELEEDILLESLLDIIYQYIDIDIESSNFIDFLGKLFLEFEAKDLSDGVLEEFMQFLQDKFPEIKIDADTVKQQITKILEDKDLSKPYMPNLQKEKFSEIDVKPHKNSKNIEDEAKNVENFNVRSEKINEDKSFFKGQELKVQKQRLEESSEFETMQNKLTKKPDSNRPLIIENETENINLDHVATYTLNQNMEISQEPIEVNVELPQDKPVDFNEVFDKIIQKIDTVVQKNAEVIKIRLKPDFLGEVMIKIVSEKGQLKTQLFIENAEVRKAFYVNAPKLEEQIQEQGYNSVKVDIYDMTNENGYMDYQNQQNGQNQDFTKPKRHFYQNFREKDIEKDINDYDSWYDVSSVNCMV